MDAAQTDTTYNGWSNYPTWCVNLWLSNDEALYREALDCVQRATLGGFAQASARRFVADDFKAWVVDELAPDLGASFASDLLGYALDQVNWYEIAGAWLEDSVAVL